MAKYSDWHGHMVLDTCIISANCHRAKCDEPSPISREISSVTPTIAAQKGD